MKKLVIAASIGSLIFAGCQEKAPFISFHDVVKVDTTYVLSTIPATDPHQVLIEEYTGQSCSNCPGAHVQLEGFEAANPGRINVIGLYEFGPTQTIPPGEAANDLRDSTATSIANSIYGGVNLLPSAGIDRVPVSNSVLLNKPDWPSTVNTRLTIVDSMNLSLVSSYNAATNVATIIATVTYTKPVTTKNNLSIVVVEDSIIDYQEYPVFDPVYKSGMDTFYVFKNAMRGMVSAPPYGDAILDSMATKEAGRVYSRTYTYTPRTTSPAIKPKHCRVIGFVSSNTGTNLQIYQSAQTKLAP